MIALENIKECHSVFKISGKNPDKFYPSLSTDTRTIAAGEMFLALDGAKYRGITFLDAAILKGAKVVIYKSLEEDNALLANLIAKNPEVSFISVSDTLVFLQELASRHITSWRKKSGKIVIGITGSNGKTTTKEMLFHILSALVPNRVFATKGNLNNHIGVPLTLLRADESIDFMVVEMGTNHFGEIEKLCEIAAPDFGIITSIGASHLEFLKSEEGVFKEKSSLYESIRIKKVTAGVLVVPSGDYFLKRLKGKSRVKAVGENGDISANILPNSLKIFFEGHGELLIKNSDLDGVHNYSNLALAVVMADQLVSGKRQEIIHAAESFKPKVNRSSWLKRDLGCSIYLDAYNANPSSMKASLQAFVAHLKNNAIAPNAALYILGDMNELGELSSELHQEIGLFLNELGAQNAIFVGVHAKDYREKFKIAGTDYETSDKLLKDWPKLENRYKYIFIKGSRSLQLEKVLGIT